jgi:hypothetical protein
MDVDLRLPTPEAARAALAALGAARRPGEGHAVQMQGLDAAPEPAPSPVPEPVKGPRDRLAVHFGWEIVLLLGAAAVGLLLWRADPATLRGAALRELYLQTAVVGAVTVGMALSLRAAGPLLELDTREIVPTEHGRGLMVLALGAALLGGTSVYGRHGGLFGTALAVIGLTLLSRYAAAEDRAVSVFALAAAAIAVGLMVSRLVEALGRPKPVPEVVAAEAPAQQPYEPEIDDAWSASQSPVWTPHPSERSPEDRRWDERWASH